METTQIDGNKCMERGHVHWYYLTVYSVDFSLILLVAVISVVVAIRRTVQ